MKYMPKKIIFSIIAVLILVGGFIFISQQSGLDEPPSDPISSGEQAQLVTQSKIIFVSPDDEIAIMDSDGTDVKKLTNTGPQVIENDLSWSPDGTKILFKWQEPGGDAAIYIMNSDGSNPKRLSPSPGKDSTPSWSPDGKQIAFSSSRDGQAEIYVMDNEGKNIQRLTFNTGNTKLAEECKGDKMTQDCQAFELLGFDVRSLDFFPAWSPDGKKIVFLSVRDGDQEIFIMNSDGSDMKQLTFNSVPDGEMAFSPDGKKIYFPRAVDNNAHIFVMNTDGTNQTQLTFFSNHVGDMSFSPDGKKIVFQRNIDDRAEVWMMNADGSNAVSLKQKCNVGYCSPRWQPIK